MHQTIMKIIEWNLTIDGFEDLTPEQQSIVIQTIVNDIYDKNTITLQGNIELYEDN
jgi:hypothetical protein